MGSFLLQCFGLVLLGGGVWLGYTRWIKPQQNTLDKQGLLLLVLVVLTWMGGFIGGPFWWFDQPLSFSWDLPPLASRMLASAGWAFVVACYFALQRPSQKRVRLVLVLLAVYLVPLVVVILLFHLNYFDFKAPITYAFFVIAGGMAVATIWFLLRPLPVLPDTAQDSAPASAMLMGWLTAVAILTALWGLALFITDNGPAAFIWVWPGDILTSRLIGVMLLAIATGSALSRNLADSGRIMLAVNFTYGLGLALASLWNTLAGKPIKPSYFIVFGLIALVSAVLYWQETAAAPVKASS